MNGKKTLKGKEKAKFEAIQKRLWEIHNEQESLQFELEKMGLKFDIMGMPKNFKLGD